MIPIYFHAKSHFWIAYLFFFNGLLLSYCFANWSGSYRKALESFEARVITGFALSLGLNAALLLLADRLDVSWLQLRYVLFSITFIGVLLSALLYRVKRQPLLGEFSFVRLIFYFFVFIVMFYNGGLIEQISDAWWHMSLSNKIAHERSFFLSGAHLDGVSSRYYPQLWHGNLALAGLLGNERLPILWNSFTAWGAVLKVMAFYLFAYGLSKDKVIALLACVLFFLLPGLGVSYMRVSAWPSHVAYVILFITFYLSFLILDDLPKSQLDSVRGLPSVLKALLGQQLARLSLLALFLIQLYFIHQLEVLLYFLAMFAYVFAVNVNALFRPPFELENGGPVIRLFWYLAVIITVGFTVKLIVDENWAANKLDLLVAYLLPVVLLGLALCVIHFNAKKLTLSCAMVGALLVLLSVDYTHLASLFFPEMALPMQQFRERPVISQGYFGGQLYVPGWHLQLRQGLLYAGVVAVPLSAALAYFRPSRLTLFLAANAMLVWTFCVSPYLFQWLRDITSYHSSWRVAMLIFTPLIFSTAIVLLIRNIAKERKGE